MENLKKYKISEEDIQKALPSVLAEVRAACPDAPIAKNISSYVGNVKGGITLGLCHRKDGCFQIRINRRLFLSGYLGPEALRSTMLHEVIHTFDGCFNHGQNFHYWAAKLNRLLGCEVGTYATEEEHMQSKRVNVLKAKAITVCTDCSDYIVWQKMSPTVKYWAKRGWPATVHGCKKGKTHLKVNMFAIKYNGKHLFDSSMCDPSIREKADAWFEKHVPPKELCSYFEWTPERIETEFWWKKEEEEEEEEAFVAEEIKKPKEEHYEQMSLF